MTSHRTAAQLIALKQQLSSVLLANPKVQGLGVGATGLRVYLNEEDADTRAKVQSAIQAADPEAPFECLVSGPIIAQQPQRKPTRK